MHHAPGFLAAVERARARVGEIGVEEVRALQDAGASFRFVDVREDREWAVDHCTGAEHLGRGVLERDVEGMIPDPATPIIVYCGGGFRSALAAVSLQDMGYQDVRSMAGGIRAWREAGAPLTVGE